MLGKLILSKIWEIIRKGLAKRADLPPPVAEILGDITKDDIERFHHHDEPND